VSAGHDHQVLLTVGLPLVFADICLCDQYGYAKKLKLNSCPLTDPTRCLNRESDAIEASGQKRFPVTFSKGCQMVIPLKALLKEGY
jgi:hypothetical protein